MAKDSHPPLSNVADIDSAIVDDFKRLLRLDAEIDAAIAEHVQPMKDERKEMWSNLAAKVDLPKKDIGLFYKLFQRQEMSRQFEDEDDGKAVREAHRMLFSALAKGKTLDFIDVLGQAGVTVAEKPKRERAFKDNKSAAANDRDDSAAPNEPAPDTKADAQADNPDLSKEDPTASSFFIGQRASGAGALAKGKGEDACPFKAGSQAFVAWMHGYYMAEGAKAYHDDEAVTACRYSTGSHAWKSWTKGWNEKAKGDGADAGTKGAEAAGAVKGAAGSDMPDTSASPRGPKAATTTQTGTA
ncbi:hypothetical protein [Thalassobaculum sp.]|uniref:hypothetical protein n=1 Tax=Thalassobaculum sp. TaxID=2022740 RepID=UPI0032F067A3